MSAADLLKKGDLDGAARLLMQEVRAAPGDAKLRTFLFQLACVQGDWERAKTQLAVAADLDAGTTLMARTYGDAVALEAERAAVFAGKAAPTILGRPEPWMAELIEALRLEATGAHEAAAALRDRALDAAPAFPGRLDGAAFAWIADADPRLGPMLEILVNGRYFWLPMMRIRRLVAEAPADLRDAVWTPVQIVLANGGEIVGLVPTRYAGSEKSPDPRIRLARLTDWVESGGAAHGVGQRLLATDAGDHALMDIRLLELETPSEAPDAPPGAPAAGEGSPAS